jgi:quercetin dioxygenase-like cupin family protein
MELQRQRPTTKAPAATFTGDVYFDVIARGDEPSRLRVNSVHFCPCGRTAWHKHRFGQTLYVTEGIGYVQSRGGPRLEIRPGDIIAIAPEEWHWHGAAPDHFMTHLAMWEGLADGSETEWGEHVTDDEYRAQPQAAGAPHAPNAVQT